MPRICILDKSQNNKCINVVNVESDSDWFDHHTYFRSPRDDGEIGWILKEDGEWETGIKEETYEEKCLKERQRRDKYLKIHIDVLNGPRWDSLSQEKKDAWSNYRQELLNVPQQSDFPENIIWPTKPE